MARYILQPNWYVLILFMLNLKLILISIAETFVTFVSKIEVIRKKLSPETRTTINEFGVILHQDGMQPSPPPIPDMYWNACGAQYAYAFIRLSTLGIDALGMSQLVGYPSQFPSVSMLNWDNGAPNARYWVLDIIIRHFGLKNGKRDVHLMETTISDSRIVLAQSYVTTDSAGEFRKILLVNKVASRVPVTVTGAAKATIEYHDVETGPYTPPKSRVLDDDSFLLGGLSVAVVTLKN
jgi:hypothetical protein